MRSWFPKRIVLGLAGLALGVLATAYLDAQPPGKGKGPKGRPGPPSDAEFVTVRGTVKEFTTAPKGEVDGLMLRDGKWVHWPPHLQNRFKDVAGKGDRVRAAGYWETGPMGDTKLEVSTLTNLDNDKTAENPDRPPPARARLDDSAGPRAGDAQTVRGIVKGFTSAPKGEVDGARLDDGTWLHWPPHLQDRFKDVAAKGDRVRATGRTETGPAGDTHFEVQSVTNLRTNASAENPDFANGPRPPRGGPAADRPGGPEERLRSLEEKVDRLLREMERLRRDR
jgi:hypothetical protein